MALIAIAFLPLLVLQAQLARTALSVERAEQVTRVEANALSYLRTLNPAMRPTGQESLGSGVLLSWEATPLAQPRAVRAMSGEQGRFDVNLFEIASKIEFPDGREVSFTIRQVGWVATRPADQAF